MLLILKLKTHVYLYIISYHPSKGKIGFTCCNKIMKFILLTWPNINKNQLINYFLSISGYYGNANSH